MTNPRMYDLNKSQSQSFTEANRLSSLFLIALLQVRNHKSIFITDNG